MGWDSNPRWACTHAGFQDRCLQPLGHPSNSYLINALQPGLTLGNLERNAVLPPNCHPPQSRNPRSLTFSASCLRARGVIVSAPLNREAILRAPARTASANECRIALYPLATMRSSNASGASFKAGKVLAPSLNGTLNEAMRSTNSTSSRKGSLSQKNCHLSAASAIASSITAKAASAFDRCFRNPKIAPPVRACSL